MNTKILFFISTVLTAFVVATLYGVVTKVSSNPVAVEAAPAAASIQVVEPVPATATDESILLSTQLDAFGNVIATPSPYANMEMSHDLAALIASEAIGKQDVYSVELKTIDGVDGYEVVFSSNDVVFIGMDKQVVSISALPTQVVYIASAPVKLASNDTNNGNGNGNNNQEDDDEHEDEHEEEHD